MKSKLQRLRLLSLVRKRSLSEARAVQRSLALLLGGNDALLREAEALWEGSEKRPLQALLMILEKIRVRNELAMRDSSKALQKLKSENSQLRHHIKELRNAQSR